MSHQPLLQFNILACSLLALAALAVALSPRVRDGVVIKSGLGLMSVGFLGVAMALASAEGFDWVVAIRGLSLVNGGLLLVAAGVAIRWRRAGRVYRIDEWITPPTVAIRRPPDAPPAGGSTLDLDLEDAQRGSRL